MSVTESALPKSRPPSMFRSAFKRWSMQNAQILGPLMALVGVFVLFAALAPGDFVTEANIFNILAQGSVLAVMATGVTLVLLLGEIDLAFANIAVLSGMSISLWYSGHGVGLPILGEVYIFPGNQGADIALALAVALALGLLSGVLVARLRVPSFIATLGVLLLAQGWAFYWSQGENIFNVMPIATTLGSGFLGPVPNIAISAGVILLIGHLVLSRTRFGRYIYMTGSNPEAAKLAGIPTARIVLIVFALSGLLAGIAGILNVGRLGAAQAGSGPSDLLLPAIAAVVLGGTSLFGGRGGITYTAVGLLLWACLNNGLDQVAINIYVKPFVSGLVLLFAIVLNVVMLSIASRARAEAALEEEETAEGGAPGTGSIDIREAFGMLLRGRRRADPVAKGPRA